MYLIFCTIFLTIISIIDISVLLRTASYEYSRSNSTQGTFDVLRETTLGLGFETLLIHSIYRNVRHRSSSKRWKTQKG